MLNNIKQMNQKHDFRAKPTNKIGANNHCLIGPFSFNCFFKLTTKQKELWRQWDLKNN